MIPVQQQFHHQRNYLNYQSIHTAHQLESSNYFHSGISWQKQKYFYQREDCSEM